MSIWRDYYNSAVRKIDTYRHDHHDRWHEPRILRRWYPGNSGGDDSLRPGAGRFRKPVHFRCRRVSHGDPPHGSCQGLIYTVAGTGQVGFQGDGGVATAAQLNNPTGLAVSGSTLYFADTTNARVRKVVSFTITTVAGTSMGDNGPAASAYLNLPEGVAIDGSGNIASPTRAITQCADSKPEPTSIHWDRCWARHSELLSITPGTFT